jgi:hypothetical protein
MANFRGEGPTMDTAVYVRMRKKEKRAVTAKAKASGTSVSEYLRCKGLGIPLPKELGKKALADMAGTPATPAIPTA